MGIKRTNGNANGSDAEALPTEAPTNGAKTEMPNFRENSEVNGKIDSYIEKNPKEWAYIKAMPRERLERSLVLQSVQKLERKERMRTNILKKLEENPELKEAYRTLVKNLPAEQQEKAMAALAMRTMKTVAPSQPRQAQAARV
jgi:hypothetical protein